MGIHKRTRLTPIQREEIYRVYQCEQAILLSKERYQAVV